MTNSKIIRRLSEFGPAVIATITRPGPHCVLSSAVGQDVLKRFGIEATPYAADVTVCNSAFAEWFDSGSPGGQDEVLRRGGYVLTNSPGWTGESLPSLNPVTTAPWDGHLVLRVDDTLIDLDMGAFNRPTKNIHLPPAFVASFMGDEVFASYGAGETFTHVGYKPLVAPYADDYLLAKDWTERARFADIVTVIERRIRKGYRRGN